MKRADKAVVSSAVIPAAIQERRRGGVSRHAIKRLFYGADSSPEWGVVQRDKVVGSKGLHLPLTINPIP